MKHIRRWRGLKSLVQDAVDGTSRLVERAQTESAARPFAVLEALPEVGEVAKVVHVLHNASVHGTHTAIRGVNRVVGAALDGALDVIEARDAQKKP